MFKKIKSIKIHVNDVAEAADFYANVFGLKPLWRDEREDSAGLLFFDTNAEITLFYDPLSSGQIEVHYLVDDVVSAVQKYTEHGCTIIVQPFDTQKGKSAVIQDPFGTQLYIVDMSKQEAEQDLL